MRQMPGPDEEEIRVDDLEPGDLLVQGNIADTVISYTRETAILSLKNGGQRIVASGQRVIRKKQR